GDVSDFRSVNEVRSMPRHFTSYIEENRQRFQRSRPYFVLDNYVGGDLNRGLRFASTAEKSPVRPARSARSSRSTRSTSPARSSRSTRSTSPARSTASTSAPANQTSQ